ncbi:DUF1310 family protein [Latilactobacillus fuchuensis]|uniref:DUF1310 family protein n=1 Tax=Latilactobacillus fuchuensis DSM 14340 = JCM 11249 TaxID=1423747 RepID=A0A0R1RWD5_9LACO|nr:DUF1310 family protein [Latilactobacillus fuchuensis]KRL61407.1 hypothetical protein FC69_GL000812 [Latilactobacillus fuchuensis DSM 14340 = JCM 11249]
MTKTMKIIIGSVVLIAIGLGGGLFYRHEKQVAMQQEMIEIVRSKEATDIFEYGIQKLDSQAFTKESIIQNYSVDESTIEHNPLGGINVTLFINHDKDLYIFFILDKDNGKLTDNGGGNSANLEKLLAHRHKQ